MAYLDIVSFTTFASLKIHAEAPRECIQIKLWKPILPCLNVRYLWGGCERGSFGMLEHSCRLTQLELVFCWMACLFYVLSLIV